VVGPGTFDVKEKSSFRWQLRRVDVDGFYAEYRGENVKEIKGGFSL